MREVSEELVGVAEEGGLFVGSAGVAEPVEGGAGLFDGEGFVAFVEEALAEGFGVFEGVVEVVAEGGLLDAVVDPGDVVVEVGGVLMGEGGFVEEGAEVVGGEGGEVWIGGEAIPEFGNLVVEEFRVSEVFAPLGELGAAACEFVGVRGGE